MNSRSPLPPSPQPPPPRRVLIVGGGFCGVVTAVQLLRQAREPLTVQLVEQPERLARGLAYGTPDAQHLLNVPAGNMSALAEDADHFLRHLMAQAPGAWHAGSFVPRGMYGQYLRALLDQALAAHRTGPVRLELVAGQVTGVQPGRDGQPAQASLADGRPLLADAVVLATGHAAAAHPLGEADRNTLGPAYIADPWQQPPAAALERTASVLLLGAGLTATDVLVSLARAGHRGPVHLLSRRGLSPQPHREHLQRPLTPQAGPLLAEMGTGVRGQLRALRRHADAAMAEGGDWRDWIAALRPHTPAWWQGLSEADRRRFLRHLQPRWDVLRHRCAPEVQARVAVLEDAGQLHRLAGRVLDVQPQGQRFVLRWRPRSAPDEAGTVQSLVVDVVINCTGPSTQLTAQRAPLLAALVQAGHAVPDALSLGLQVGPGYGLLDARGREQPGLRYVGPLLRARDWEATAVPELRVHAARLARALLAAPGPAGRPA